MTCEDERGFPELPDSRLNALAILLVEPQVGESEGPAAAAGDPATGGDVAP